MHVCGLKLVLAHVHLHHNNKVETEIFAMISDVAPSKFCLAMVAGEAGMLSTKGFYTARNLQLSPVSFLSLLSG
jgi:hypothetical protein